MGILPWSVDEIEGEYLGAVMKLLVVLFLFGALANLHTVRSLPRRPIIKKNDLNVEGRTAGSQILCSENCEAYRDFLTTRHADGLPMATESRGLVKRGFFDKVKDLANKAKKAAKKAKDAAKNLATKAKDAVKDKVGKLIKKTIKEEKKRDKRSLVTTGYRSLVKRGFFDKVKDLAKKTKKAAKRLPPALKNWAKKKAKDAVKSQVNRLKEKKKLQGRGRRSTADSRGFSPSSGVQVVRHVIRQGQDNQ